METVEGFGRGFPTMRPEVAGSLDDGQGFTPQRYGKRFSGVADFPE